VPLSLSRLPVAARFGVFELGMNHPGEIAPLSRMVRPDVAVITAIEAVHLAFFASTRQIAEAKAEIFQGVEAGGIAILPRDNPHYEQLRDAAHAAGIGRVQSFGNHIEANARLLHCGVDQSGTTVFALIEEREVSYRIGVPGRHWASNSLAVLLAAEALGVDAKIAANALANMAAPKGRGERRSLPWGTGSILVIDESYNASPASMRAAIANLGAAHVEAKGRRIAVLGDMLELGDAAATLHAGLAESLRHWRIDKVFTVGPLMRHLHDALPAACRAGHADSSDLAAQPVAAMARAGDAIMVKGSAGSRMSRVVQTLDALAAPMKPVANGN
jgi:UDP-N-acetylmuramoyl-tripeptide--D-alanyl-D-alanine ligase